MVWCAWVENASRNEAPERDDQSKGLLPPATTILPLIRQPSRVPATQKSLHCAMGSLICPRAVPAQLRLQPHPLQPAGSRHANPISSHRPLRPNRAKAALESTEHQGNSHTNNADARDTGNTASPVAGRRRVAVFKAATSGAVAVEELGRPLGEWTAACGENRDENDPIPRPPTH
jgi:hypothetical protein